MTGEFPPAVGGVGDHTARLAIELTDAGHHVHVLTSVSPAAPVGSEQASRLIRKWDHRIWWQVPRFACDREWDVLHIQYQPAMYGLHGAINVLPWAVRSERPAVVTTFHDLRVPYLFPKAGPLRSALVAALAKGSDGVIAASDDDLPRLRRWRSNSSAATTRHVPLGDQLDAALPDGFSAVEWRARLGLAPKTPLIGYFGLVNSSKGLLELVQSVALIADAHLLIIGEQLGASDPSNRAYHAAVQERLERMGISDRVHWTGYVPASVLGGWLDTVDVVALPYGDGASLRRTSLITAWRRGRAVVTTEPAPHALWGDDAAGRVAARFVAAGDVVALAGVIRDLLAHPHERVLLGQAGARFAERFSWPSVVSQTVSVYEAAISARRA
ncbi:MAG: glycosyltransferase family 4 protein [Chloroflexota bacterium]